MRKLLLVSQRVLRENRIFLVFLVLMFAFRSTFADWNTVPTGSMQPTIVEGDRIFVNRMAYDLRIPFTHLSLYHIADPARGDIVVFDSEVAGKKLVKRVIGLPGDRVSLHANRLVINGQPVRYQRLRTAGPFTESIEHLGTVSHHIRTARQSSGVASFAPVAIPDGYYLMLGDNRDRSADSRAIGLVPRHEIVGRTRHVVLSFDYNNYYLPRSDRFLHPL